MALFLRGFPCGLRQRIKEANTGIVCFITVAGFLSGQGFQKMRDYLRRTCDDIWVIDCSPEGYQPGVNTRIFQGVQQPVCIVLASRSSSSNASNPAKVLFRALPSGHREEKFTALNKITLGGGWIECPSDWRAPFLRRVDRSVGNVPEARRALRLQRVWRDARTNVDHCSGCKFVGAPLEETCASRS